MTPLEETDIERLRELLAKATPGPWGWWGYRVIASDEQFVAHTELMRRETYDQGHIEAVTNAELIAEAVNALPALLKTATRVKVLEENLASATDLLRLLVAYDDEAKPNGIQDCVDNDGQPYQSAAMAGLVTHARMIAAPFDMAQALRDIGGGGMNTARTALTASEDDRGSKGEGRG